MFERRLRSLRRLLPVLVLFAAACGGGGSSSDVPAAPTDAQPDGPGRLESAAQINRITAADIAQALRAPDSRNPALAPVYDVTNHRLIYRTTDRDGREIVASALIAVPAKPAGRPSPVFAYQHATIVRDADAPSRHASADEAAVVLASLGYIVVAADYVGYGASRGAPHPYLLAAPSAAAVIDGLTAARTWRSRHGVADNGQLFMAGYSEGGFVTMAAHRALQASGASSPLVAAAPGAGPYDAGVTLDELLRRVTAAHPALARVVTPGLLRNASDDVRRQVRNLLLLQLLDADTDVLFDTTLIDRYLADDRAAIERDSRVDDWAPIAPVRLFHGRDDQTVPYVASTQALQSMRARGAADVSLTDCAVAPSSHIGCVPAYLSFVLSQFAPWVRDL